VALQPTLHLAALIEESVSIPRLIAHVWKVATSASELEIAISAGEESALNLDDFGGEELECSAPPDPSINFPISVQSWDATLLPARHGSQASE